jgi:hypothetical protein
MNLRSGSVQDLFDKHADDGLGRDANLPPSPQLHPQLERVLHLPGRRLAGHPPFLLLLHPLEPLLPARKEVLFASANHA